MNKIAGLYIHLPFCLKKCAYCDFVSYENCLGKAEEYVSDLLSEMETYRGETIDTVYLGGGTPTALPPRLLVRILEGVRKNFVLLADTEITVEANPGTADEQGFRTLADAGVNRVSLGAQSFIDAELSALGRIHTAAQTKEAVEMVRKAGIHNISLDLMFSLPHQTKESLTESLDAILALAPDHVSCYSLTVCEDTPLCKSVETGAVLLPDEETDREFYGLICDTLEKNGYGRYEISNFAKAGRESRHNTKYWLRAPYMGLGAGAHSFYGGRRFENPAGLATYHEVVLGAKARESEIVTEADAMAEFMFLGLRMTKAGVLRSDFKAAFNRDLDAVYGDAIKKLTNFGLLLDTGHRLVLTERGIDLSNTVFCEFV